MVDYNYFSKISGANFEIAGNEKTGKLYHWIWDNTDKSNEIGDFLVSNGFIKGRTVIINNVEAKGCFTRVETHAESKSDLYRFSVEYFDGKDNCIHQTYTKLDIGKRINSLTWITIIGSIASVVGVVLGVLSLCTN